MNCKKISAVFQNCQDTGFKYIAIWYIIQINFFFFSFCCGPIPRSIKNGLNIYYVGRVKFFGGSLRKSSSINLNSNNIHIIITSYY